jgi:N-acetylneuraminate synthase
LYEKAKTPLKWFPELIRECERVGIPWFSSVFGPGSLALLDALGCPAFKLASLDHGKRALHQMVAATGKPILRSSPHLARRRSEKLTLWCPPGYPQTPPFAFRSAFGPHDGFSYHGTDPDVPGWAVAHGAGIVECHVQLDDVPSELEDKVSLTVSQLRYLVERIEHHGRMAREQP